MRQKLEAIWREHRGELKSFILKRVRSSAEAEDILHDVFLKMLSGLASVQRVDHMRAWLFTVARNAVTDHFRSRRPTAALPEELIDPSPGLDAPPVKDMGACLRPMLEALPDTLRVALVMADIEGVKHREVAERLGLSLPAVKSRVLRGRLLIRRMIEDCCHLELDSRGSVMGYVAKMTGCPH